ncbi:MAG: response regulator [Pseudomonadota bacterium]
MAADHIPPTPLRILIAEDSATQAQRLTHILSQHGYAVQVATNGREALEMAALDPPSLLISDVVMPEMDGYELTRRLKAAPALRDIPVILVTTMSDPQDVIRGLECGADCFMLKPFNEQHLVSRIQYMLLNRSFRHEHDAGMGVEIHFNGQRHYITADRLQILNLLLSTYDAAMQRNQELGESQQTLKRKTAEVEASHRFLDSVIENIPVAVMIKDAQDLCFVRVNRATEALVGCSREQMLGQEAVGNPSPERLEFQLARTRAVLASGTILDIPVEPLQTYDKGVRQIHKRMVPVFDADGDPSHMLILYDDITDSVQAEAELKALNAELTRKTIELERARKAAEDATRAKSEFLAMMSHEIRTPMNGVIGMVDVLHQTSLKGDQVEMVDLIRESAFSLLAIIEDILDFSKIEADKLELESAPMSPAAVVEKACGLLDTLARKKDVELTVFADPRMPAMVLGDALRVRQVLINLANNAIKFSSGRPECKGRVSVRASLAESGPAQAVIALRVSDNGIGMTEDTQSHLFTSFSQADVSTTRRFGGTGLGLAISHRLVQLMGGRIDVQSAPGEGSTFVVHLPCGLAPASEQAPEPGALPSVVDGLDCIVVGEPEGLAADHAAYLADGGAAVERVADLAAARTACLGRPAGLVVWVVDAGSSCIAAEVLREAALLPPAQGLRVVVVAIERGRRRASRSLAEGMVTLDGNVLTRHRLLRAVAQAAGRGQGLGAAPPQEPRAPAGEPLGPPSREEAIRQGRLVLVTEDNETNQKVIQRQLGLLGIAADVVGDGRMALQRWRSGDYGLLITDLHMPVMDGYQLTQAIRQEEGIGRRRMPIVALSANTIQDEASRCLALGMDDYLSKPAQLADLRQMLAKWLSGPRSGAAARPDARAPTPAPGVGLLDPVDVNVLEMLVGDDPAVIAEFLTEFSGRAQDSAVRIRAAVQAGLGHVAEAEAHKLKSAARSVGALELGELCDELEQLGHAGQLGVLAGLLPRFEAEVARVRHYLQQR